ncbi:MAG: hypothetical protein FJX68_01310 [Alphaproteobacteria bacterium]|nr:hypothetical protein [Alphaproteobacteria bacterium]
MQHLLLRPASRFLLCALTLCLAATDAPAQATPSERNPFSQTRPLSPETAAEMFRRRQREMRIPQLDVPALAATPRVIYPRTSLPPGAAPPPSTVIFAPPAAAERPAAKPSRALAGQQARMDRGYYNSALRMQQRAERFRAARGLEADP